MCDNCRVNNGYGSKNGKNSSRTTLVVLVLFSVTVSALGISCFALLTVQKLSADLNDLKLVLRKTAVRPSSQPAYGFISNFNPIHETSQDEKTGEIRSQLRLKRGLDLNTKRDDQRILEETTLETSSETSTKDAQVSVDPMIGSLASNGKLASPINIQNNIVKNNVTSAFSSDERANFQATSNFSFQSNQSFIPLAPNSKIPSIIEDSENLMDHNIRKKAVGYDDVESFTPEYQVPRNVHRHRPRGRNGNQLEIIDEFSPQAGRLKSLIAVHLNGDTSQYTLGVHTNYRGNGHLRHPQKTFVDWKISDWVETISASNSFHLRNGVLTVEESGLYFIYAQIYYLDEHDSNGYMIRRNSENILHCKVTAPSSERLMKGNTCYTGAVVYLDSTDKISLDDISDGRYTLFIPGYSFFGMIKIGDVKGK